MARWNEERVRSLSENVPPPVNPIQGRWRLTNDDPPNLERLTSQQAIQDGGLAELYERSRGTGVHATTISDE
jgi:hypothetical protein